MGRYKGQLRETFRFFLRCDGRSLQLILLASLYRLFEEAGQPLLWPNRHDR
jgi:hypothetical protein